LFDNNKLLIYFGNVPETMLLSYVLWLIGFGNLDYFRIAFKSL